MVFGKLRCTSAQGRTHMKTTREKQRLSTSTIAKYAACLLGYSNYLYNKNSTVTHIIQSWVKRLLIIETSSKEVEQETHFLVLVAKKNGRTHSEQSCSETNHLFRL